ncbi:MAG: hypothetical protein JXB03_01365 [Spirochaetales bacterium]|nr:hypothetical protein [Spirochaetales bacterium]
MSKNGSFESAVKKLHISRKFDQVQLAYCTGTGQEESGFSCVIDERGNDF